MDDYAFEELRKLRKAVEQLGTAPVLETRLWAIYVDDEEKPDWATDEHQPWDWCKLTACDELLWTIDDGGHPVLGDVAADGDFATLDEMTNFVGVISKRMAPTETDATNLARQGLRQQICLVLITRANRRHAAASNPST